MGVRFAHLVEHAPHRQELFTLLVDILLVDLIGHNHDVLLMAQSYDALEVLSTHDLTRGVARVDDDDSARDETFGLGLAHPIMKCLAIQGPATAFVQVVRQELAAIQSQERRVERVLRDGYQNSIVAISEQGLKAGAHGLTCPIGQVNVVFVRIGHIVASVDKVSDGPAHASIAL